jgi:hypothetical protein
MKIEILQGYEQPKCFEMQAKDGKPARTFWSQDAYAYLGGAFPVKFELSIDKPTDAYPIGTYELDGSSFKVTERGKLTIDIYNIKLNKLTDSKKLERA